MLNPSKHLIDLAFKNLNAKSFIELGRKTGIHYKLLSRISEEKNQHKLISPAFKLILDNIPEEELKSFLEELLKSYYNKLINKPFGT
jgi:hypothetical protein